MRRLAVHRLPLPPLLLLLIVLSSSACGTPQIEPARNLLLISIDTLRPDHLGTYGYERDTSPFLDSLAERGVVFEHAVAHYPNTLASHMSLLTGYYPREHAVYPPDGVLSEEIPILTELLQDAGFRTGGFVENGYMKGSSGFARGFEQWNDKVSGPLPVEIEHTARRGLEFLDSIGDDERFFLFLHTYAVHDPYEPPEPFRSRYWDGPRPADAFAPVGSNFLDFNRRQGVLSDDAVAWYRALYDGSIRYADSVLAELFAELEARGLLADTTVVITSDHGEEFLEHGRLAHTQVYDEGLRIPLIVLHPGVEPRRVATLVEGVDLFPTLLELVGVEVPPTSGRSRVPEMRGEESDEGAEAFGETDRGAQRSLYRQRSGELLQLVETRPQRSAAREIRFDVGTDPAQLEVRSRDAGREVELRLDGELFQTFELPTDWTLLFIPGVGQGSEPVSRRRVAISTAPCDACGPFEVNGPDLHRLELFDLTADPTAASDLSRRRDSDLRRLARGFTAYERDPVAAELSEELDPEQEERLRALGYLD